MLRPLLNNYRDVCDLSGLWEFKVDKNNVGSSNNWKDGFEKDSYISVPGSWHEQLEELSLMHFVGTAWYSKEFFVPSNYKNKKVFIRFNSVDFHSHVWLNGVELGENHIGYLPFEFEVTDVCKIGEKNKIILSVNNQLNDDTIPQGIFSEYYEEENRLREETYPAARMDFCPSGGIHRQVLLYSIPSSFIEDVYVRTSILDEKTGKVKISFTVSKHENTELNYRIEKESYSFEKKMKLSDFEISDEVEIKNCEFWAIRKPNLYSLQIQLFSSGKIVDEYELEFGVREIKLTPKQFLLNNKPIYMKGFGKHEDYPIFGKGFNYQYLVKDFSLMKWINANSFRTSHYPYAEEFLDMADKEGFLIIDEVPAVSIDTRRTNQKTIENHKEYLNRLIQRDKNHACVVAWALGNEPNLVGVASYYDGSGERYWKEIFDYARSLDQSRPVTVPNCQRAGIDDPVLKMSDFITINRYYGWYEIPGRINEALVRLNDEIEEIYQKYNRPIMMTEFGVDTMPGFHSTSDQMFTEEYQSKIIAAYIKLLRSKDYVIGEHIWNFADFKTPQHFRRVVNNLKGIFTRDRSPKSAAFKVKELWKDD